MNDLQLWLVNLTGEQSLWIIELFVIVLAALSLGYILNKVIDRNYYPVIEAENSNFRHRPIGLGVQGLADTFIKLRLPFTSDEAKKLNQDIFETIYFLKLRPTFTIPAIFITYILQINLGLLLFFPKSN